MHMYNFLCSDSLLYFFLFLSTLHSVYTRDCSCNWSIGVSLSEPHTNHTAVQNPPNIYSHPYVTTIIILHYLISRYFHVHYIVVNLASKIHIAKIGIAKINICIRYG